MASSDIRIPIRPIVKNIKLKIRIDGIGVAKFRMWAGARIMGFAAWVIGCDIKVEVCDGGIENGD